MKMDRLVLVALSLFVILIPIASAARNLKSLHIDALELEVQHLLKRLNKPPLKSIQSLDGDIIDCILINQQPAFDHPLLKNHVIQMRPSSEPKGRYRESSSVSQLWHTVNETCPEGTVPIRRTKEEDLLRASSLEEFGRKKRTNSSSSTPFHAPLSVDSNGHEYGVVAVESGDYYGAKATINIWKPEVQQRSEFSLSQLWVVAGSGDDLNTIEAGWQVYADFYGDRNPRLFIFSTKDGYQTGCYNLVCPGFVQVSRKYTIGATLAPVSVYGGPQYEFTIHVWKDNADKKWWLKYADEVVGYWPSSLFTRLANDAATRVEFGGEITNYSEDGHTTTDMGSGHFSGEGAGKASYFKTIQTVDFNNNLQDAKDLIVMTPNPNCYDVKTGSDRDVGTFFLYGGPGKNPNCP